jgi:hypothetical protein
MAATQKDNRSVIGSARSAGFLGLDSEALTVEFDAKNRVKKAFIWRD